MTRLHIPVSSSTDLPPLFTAVRSTAGPWPFSMLAKARALWDKTQPMEDKAATNLPICNKTCDHLNTKMHLDACKTVTNLPWWHKIPNHKIINRDKSSHKPTMVEQNTQSQDNLPRHTQNSHKPTTVEQKNPITGQSTQMHKCFY